MFDAGVVITTVGVAPSWSLRDLSSPRAFARREVTPDCDAATLTSPSAEVGGEDKRACQP